MVQQNNLPGRYVILSFQEVKSVDRTGANQKGWYYHVGITEDMRDKILQRNSGTSRCQKEAQKSKKCEQSKRTEDIPQPQLLGEDPMDVTPPSVTPSVSGGGKKMEASKEGIVAVVGEALKEDTQTTDPGRPATPTPMEVSKAKPESKSDSPHLLTGEEYRHYQLLRRQEANQQREQSMGTCSGPEKPAKHGPGRPGGGCSKGRGEQCRQRWQR